MKHLMILLVRFYKKFISPILPGSCRFTPTCSQYGLEAFRKRGFFIGLILTVYRILRCNPFCRGGYDPVPEKGFRNPTVPCEESECVDDSCIHENDEQEKET